MGDFNLNYAKKNNVGYKYENFFNDFDEVLFNMNLIQLINFPTWSRIVNNVLRESILDHVYVKNPTLVEGVRSIKPCFGDHLLISLSVRVEKDVIKHTIRRDWRKYSKEVLLAELALIEWSTDLNSVQNVWDEFESNVIKTVDKSVPVTKVRRHYRMPPK